MRQEKAIPVSLSSRVYFELCDQMYKSGDRRSVEHVVGMAVKHWLARGLHTTGARGYQWKELFLPEGTRLRFRFQEVYYDAKVEGDEILYEDFPVSPDSWIKSITGQVRNAWRDIWIRRSISDCWMRAATWRSEHKEGGTLACAERRRRYRRSVD